MSAQYLTERSMKKLVICLTLAATLPSAVLMLEVTIDMSRVTCAQYLAMPACPIRRLLGLDERLVQPEERLRLRRPKCLCEKRGQREILVCLEPGSDRHGGPSACHCSDNHRWPGSFLMKRIIIVTTFGLPCGLTFPQRRRLGSIFHSSRVSSFWGGRRAAGFNRLVDEQLFQPFQVTSNLDFRYVETKPASRRQL